MHSSLRYHIELHQTASHPPTYCSEGSDLWSIIVSHNFLKTHQQQRFKYMMMALHQRLQIVMMISSNPLWRAYSL
ncbi:hypothetical protein L2E82_10787 [Cichorium intybus]|uniref:Uncharacterized protein n=1 Tax=Cichorium intybus TaxID=13427 RepID=A0ACB9GCI6_CICIN|nr:hypothetical protein L2E82_10787 [Cichorium intybus]